MSCSRAGGLIEQPLTVHMCCEPQVLEPITGQTCTLAAVALPSQLPASSLLPVQQQTRRACCCRARGSTRPLGCRPVLPSLWLGAWR